MDDERVKTRWRLGWPAVSAIVAVIGTCSLGGGYLAGRDATVAEAAVDRKRLADVETKATAGADEIGRRVVADAVQDSRLAELERQHEELIRRLNALIDIMWKDQIAREKRQ
jgi:hypothetical protein